MKALVLTAYREFEVHDLPRPVPGPKDVLVRVQACGICGSDVHGMDGTPATAAGRGADVAFEAVGIEAEVRMAVQSVRKGGAVTLIGNLAKDVSLPQQSVVTRQIRLQGSCASSGEYPECLELIASGQVDVERFISATAPLEDGAGWFERLYRKEPGLMKVLLKPNG